MKREFRLAPANADNPARAWLRLTHEGRRIVVATPIGHLLRADGFMPLQDRKAVRNALVQRAEKLIGYENNW
jgi:hypothetical protein